MVPLDSLFRGNDGRCSSYAVAPQHANNLVFNRRNLCNLRFLFFFHSNPGSWLLFEDLFTFNFLSGFFSQLPFPPPVLCDPLHSLR